MTLKIFVDKSQIGEFCPINHDSLLQFYINKWEASNTVVRQTEDEILMFKSNNKKSFIYW